MSHPDAFLLPGLSSSHVPLRPLPGTGLQMPLPASDPVRTVWRHMQRSAGRWRRLAVGERVERLSRLAATMLEHGPGDDASRLARSTGLSTSGLHAAWEVTLRPWRRPGFEELLRSERWGEDGLVENGDRLPHRLLHVLSGNVLPPTWSLLMRSWLLGAATWVRPGAREPLFAGIAVRQAVRYEPLLEDMTAVTWWPHAEHTIDPLARDVGRAAQVMTLHGSDASVEEFARHQHDMAPGARFVSYGSRWSAVFLGREGLTNGTAQSVARDVALFDQQGCLSPTHVFAPPGPELESWCDRLAAALATREEVLPRGEPGTRARASLRHWFEQMRLEQVQGRVRRLWGGGPSVPWCVVLTERLQNWQSPLDRCVLVQPVRDRRQWFEVFADTQRRLQGIAVAPTPGQDPWLQHLLERLDPTWLCAVGQLQEPPPRWRQDHRAPLRSLLLETLSDATGPTRPGPHRDDR